MKIGMIEINEKDLKIKPKEPKWNNPTAHPNCDCEECEAIIKWDAWCKHSDFEITGQRLIDAVKLQNGWLRRPK